MLKITKRGQKHLFDRQVKSGKGFLFAIKIMNKGESELKEKYIIENKKKKQKWTNEYILTTCSYKNTRVQEEQIFAYFL